MHTRVESFDLGAVNRIGIIEVESTFTQAHALSITRIMTSSIEFTK